MFEVRIGKAETLRCARDLVVGGTYLKLGKAGGLAGICCCLELCIDPKKVPQTKYFLSARKSTTFFTPSKHRNEKVGGYCANL